MGEELEKRLAARSGNTDRASGLTAGKKAIFLETLARTCNVTKSARAIAVDLTTVYRHRRTDPAFKAQWEEALDIGMADLELQLMERARQIKPSTAESEGEMADPDLAKFLYKENRRRRGGGDPGGKTVAPASWQEVEDWFVAKLKIVRQRAAKAKRKAGK